MAMSVTLTGIVCNDDFTDRLTDVPFFARTRRPAFILAQEAKETAYKELLNLGRYAVRQHPTSEAKQGVALVTDRRQVMWAGGWEPRIGHIGGGYALLCEPHGHQMLDRYIVWQDITMGDAMVRIASTHRPPKRYDDLWVEFDTNLLRWANRSEMPLVIGMDSNQEGGPHIGGGLAWHGIRIDGVLVRDVVVGSVRALPRRNSDHRAISVAVTVPARR